MSHVITEEWLKKILVDPINKDNLEIDTNKSIIYSSYGKCYKIVNGIFDLRVPLNPFEKNSKEWENGQIDYEKYVKSFSINDKNHSYIEELNSVEKIYNNFPLIGRTLDVGGNFGTLREYLKKDQEYVIIDPYLDVFQNLDKRINLKNVFKSLERPVAFICGYGEHLPFRSLSFATVHMRSVVDHFKDANAAISEAYRVLNWGGQLIIGTSVIGGRNLKIPLVRKIKDKIKKFINKFNSNYFYDHHIWHPTYSELIHLIKLSGFVSTSVIWQEGTNDSVCYIKAIK